MDSASPDEMLRAAAVHDATGRNYVSDYDPELNNEVDSELPWETRVPDPFEGPWDSAGAGELDKITSQVDQEIADLGSHIGPGGEAVYKQGSSTTTSGTVEKAAWQISWSRRRSG